MQRFEILKRAMRHAVAITLIAGGAALADTAMLQAINAERAEAGRTALQWDARLEAAAQGHADDMVARGYFSHEGQDGSSMTDRMARAGFRGCFAAENIAQGQRSLDAVMVSWMKSRGHRRNILHRKARSVGLARGQNNMWVMVLGAPC